ncbi:MAG: type VI secretion system ATPase TssH, partial [Armatimonadota bacterium]|nr:type VI secretion system ATPase TssH [Armatimonadota bacterium]MDW8143583.1 type VI secretion system ATPase TssH [Armatimonadota bacterium]
TFNRLTKEHIQQIVDLQFERLKQRVADKRITLELTETARAKLAELGYDPTFGARPLRRTMEKHIANPLAKMVISGQIKEGEHVKIDYDENRSEFTFTVVQKAEPAAAA